MHLKLRSYSFNKPDDFSTRESEHIEVWIIDIISVWFSQDICKRMRAFVHVVIYGWLAFQ